MGEHRTLGEPRRPAGVEQPCGRVLVDVAWWFVGRRRPDDVGVARKATGSARVVADHDHVLHRRDVAEQWLDVFEVLLLDDQHACLGVVEDPHPLLGVEPVVEERECHPGRGNAVVALDVLGDVLGEDSHTVAGRGEIEHRVGDPPRGVAQLAERHGSLTSDDRRARRRLAPVQSDDVTQQHRPPSRVPELTMLSSSSRAFRTSAGRPSRPCDAPGQSRW